MHYLVTFVVDIGEFEPRNVTIEAKLEICNAMLLTLSR